MITLRGAGVSAKIKEEAQKTVKTLRQTPKLAIVRVGDNPADISYETGALKKTRSFGLEAESFVYPADIAHEAFKEQFLRLNADPSIHGILLMRPLPKQIRQQEIEHLIDPGKDLDGISPVNIAKVFCGDETGFAPCTAEAVIACLKAEGIAAEGKRAVVVGRSMVVGRPLAMLLLRENATVTICHTRTANLEETCREAEILAVCAGRAKMIDRRFVRDGAVVLDVGINVDEDGRLCGDVDFEDIADTAACATPVPGGIGAVTTAVLATHLVRAAARQEAGAGLHTKTSRNGGV